MGESNPAGAPPGTASTGAAALHPDAAAYLKLALEWQAKSGLPPLSALSADRMRRLVRGAVLSMRPPLPEIALVEDRVIAGRAGPITIRLLRPEAGRDRKLPAALYFHGGGYVLGSIDESEHEARRIALRTPALVVSVQYRLAPEHPFPAAVEDGYDALLWLAHHAAECGADPARLMVGGTSAGGGLAAAVVRLAATGGGPRIALMYLLCPWLDMTLTEPSVAEFGRGFGLDQEELEWYAEAYLGQSGRAEDPLISPALHPAPAGMPPAFILAAECDPLRDEAFRFADRLGQAGVPVMRHRAAGMVHAFNLLEHFIPAAGRPIGLIDRALRAV